MGGELIALLVGCALGAWLRTPKTKLVLQSESDVLRDVRERLDRDIADCKEFLQSDRCGWSDGDRTRLTIRLYERIRNRIPPMTQEQGR